MIEPEFKKIICSQNVDQCPYHLAHCWLGEIDSRSLNDSVPLLERLPCRKKKSRLVICILGMT